MTVKQVTCFIAACDDCNDDYEQDYTPHWPSAAEAIDGAVDNGNWWSKDEALLCYDCRYKPHAFIPSDLNADDCDRCPNPRDEHEGGCGVMGREFLLDATIDDVPVHVVTICGSTRFRAEMAEANRRLTMAGHIVLAPGVFAHDGDEITEAQKEALDRLHLSKIDMSGWVYVVNPGGYIGHSTQFEIAYATSHDKPVQYLVAPGGES